jgi:translation initiation factor IF-2
MDLVGDADRKKLAKIKFGRGVLTIPISAVAGEGTRELLDELWKMVNQK